MNNTLSSVWIAEFGKKLPTRLDICSHCLLSICNIYLFPVLVLLLQFLFIAFLLLLSDGRTAVEISS